MSVAEEREERAREAWEEAAEDEPLCYDWCGLGIGLCLRPLGHDEDCSPYPDTYESRSR